MKSLEERKYTRTLEKAYKESCEEIEKERLLSVLKAIHSYNDNKVSLQQIANNTRLNPKTISRIIVRQGYMFKCVVHPDKRDSYTADDISLYLTNSGKEKLKFETLYS